VPEQGSATLKRAQQGSAFYESLANAKTFAGTAMEFARLRRAIVKLSGKSAKGGT
jgi:hypothetical protein